MKFKIIKACEEDIDSMSGLLKNFLPYAKKHIGFNKPPVIFFKSDEANGKKLLGKTAHYDPVSMQITLYTSGRHPKDVLRSLAHELVHHGQNCRGDFRTLPDTSPGYAQEDGPLRKMEREAYEVGNLCFRDWEDGVKSNKIPLTMQLKESLFKKSLIKEEQHNVVRGDSLSGLAKKYYQDASKWPLIYKVNRQEIGENPDLIQQDTQLEIPDVAGWDAMPEQEKREIYAMSTFSRNAGVLEPASSEKPTQVDASNVPVSDGQYVFPLLVDPTSITPFGWRNAIPELEAKYAPTGPQPDAKKYERYRQKHQHFGTDLATPTGSDVVATVSGVIKKRGFNPGMGNYVYLDGSDGIEHGFLHLSKILVNKGQQVKAGDVLAKSGNSGSSSGPHLHYQARKNGNWIDPMTFFSGRSSLSEWKNVEINKLLTERFTKGKRK